MHRHRSVAAVILAALVLVAPVATAHAIPRSTTPASGARLAEGVTEIRAEFTEDLDPAATTVSIRDAQGDPIPQEELRVENDRTLIVALPGKLATGSYLVQWETISATDGHKTRGSWSFVVGPGQLLDATDAESTSFQPDAVLGKLLLYAGLALIIATLVFAVTATLPAAHYTLLRRVAAWGAVLALAGGVLFLASQVRLSGMATDRYLFGTSFGRGLLVRTAFTLAIAALAPLAKRGTHRTALGTLVALLLVAMSAYSHAAAFLEPTWMAIGVNALHDASLLAWAGGLAILSIHAYRLDRAGADPSEARRAGDRFGRIATVSVTLAVVTGAVMFLLLNGLDPQRWVKPGYAATLTLHTTLGLVMIALGGLNRWRFVPALVTGAVRALKSFRRSVGTEATVALVAILVAAALTNLQPPSDAAAQSQPPAPNAATIAALAGTEYGFHTTITPGPTVGWESNISVHVFRLSDGAPATNAYRTILALRHIEQNVTSDRIPLQELEEGRYATTGAYFTLTGEYEATLYIQTPQVYRDTVTWRFNATAAR